MNDRREKKKTGDQQFKLLEWLPVGKDQMCEPWNDPRSLENRVVI